MNEISVLACVYKILAESSKNTLETLSKSKSQPQEILAVMQALKEAKLALATQEKSGASTKKSTIAQGTGDSQASWSAQSKRLWKSIQVAVNDNKLTKITNKMILQAFSAPDFRTRARSKDGKRLMLIKIKKSLDAVSDHKRINILENALASLGLSQTKGYMDAVRSKKY